MSLWFQHFSFGRVTPRLAVGAYPLDAGDVARLAADGVERVLNLCEDAEYEHGTRDLAVAALAEAGIEELRAPCADYGGLPSPVLDRAAAVTASALERGDSLYVHCRAGWQRSAAVAAAALAAHEQVDLERALATVRAGRPEADPLPHQLDDVRAWLAARGIRHA